MAATKNISKNINNKTGNKRYVLTDEERRIAADAVYEKSKEMGIPIEMNKAKVGGYINMTEKVGRETITSRVEWVVDKYGYVSMAGVLPSNTKSGYSYLLDSDDYQTTANVDRKELIKLSRKAVKYEGVVSTAVEALVEVPTLGGWFVYCENEELYILLKYWLNNFGSSGSFSIKDDITVTQQVGGIEKFTLNMLWSLYQDGDAVITEAWENVPVPELNNKKRNLPTRYIDHDVAELDIPTVMSKFGQELIYGTPDEEITALLDGTNLNDKQKKARELIPDEMLASLKEKGDEILLPPEFTTHFSRRTNNRDPWGLPYVIKAFPALAYKHRLRDLDNATIDGLIQRIWIVKIGNDDVESDLHLPNEERILLAVSTFAKLQTQNFVIWPGTDLQTEEFGTSENSVLSFQDRYKSADDDIRVALGVPKLFYGESGGKDIDWGSFAKTISQMERYQIMIKRWIDVKMRQIAVENGFKDQFPSFWWMFLKTQDREKSKNLITKLYELNLIGIRMSHNFLGLDSDIIIRSAQREKEEKLKESLPENVIPYTRPSDGRPEDVKDDDGDSPESKPSDPDSKRDGK